MSDEVRKSVIDRGKRAITLRPHPDGRERVLEPNKTIECIDESEFKLLTGYKDIADVAKIAPQLAQREEKLREQLKAAEDENKKLKAARDAVVPEPEPVPAVKEKKAARTKKGR